MSRELASLNAAAVENVLDSLIAVEDDLLTLEFAGVTPTPRESFTEVNAAVWATLAEVCRRWDVSDIRRIPRPIPEASVEDVRSLLDHGANPKPGQRFAYDIRRLATFLLSPGHFFDLTRDRVYFEDAARYVQTAPHWPPGDRASFLFFNGALAVVADSLTAASRSDDDTLLQPPGHSIALARACGTLAGFVQRYQDGFPGLGELDAHLDSVMTFVHSYPMYLELVEHINRAMRFACEVLLIKNCVRQRAIFIEVGDSIEKRQDTVDALKRACRDLGIRASPDQARGAGKGRRQVE
jgi:hypothetical protein